MAIRFSPYAVVKVLSLGTLLESLNVSSLSDAINRMLPLFNDVNGVFQRIATNGDVWNETFFKSIGLAENISIDESYNSRPVWGIGEPANPIVVPNNYSASISISRLTLDTVSIREFTTLPDYWYAPRIQRIVESAMSAVPNAREILDYPFYTFLFISSIEERSRFPSNPINVLDEVLNRRFYSFMPSDYSQRITSGDSIIVTEVRGTGKLITLRELLEELSGALS
jgi:hypothetical protein